VWKGAGVVEETVTFLVSRGWHSPFIDVFMFVRVPEWTDEKSVSFKTTSKGP
jgi:hypothetical protein